MLGLLRRVMFPNENSAQLLRLPKAHFWGLIRLNLPGQVSESGDMGTSLSTIAGQNNLKTDQINSRVASPLALTHSLSLTQLGALGDV